MKKFILFDSDGVLVDTEQYYLRASQDVLSEIGLHLTTDLFREISLIRGTGVWDAFPELTDERQIEELRNRRNRLFNEYLKSEPIIIPHVKEVVEELSRKYRMAIVTSALREDFLTVHARSELLPYFEFYLTNGDYPRSKPFPDPWLTALDRFKGKCSDAVVIEDSQRGITAGVAAGITTIAIPTLLTIGSDFTNANFTLSSILELPNLIESL